MRSRLFTHALVVALLCHPLSLLAADESLPRYDLPVGRKLTYSLTSEMKGENTGTTYGNNGTFTVTVLRENPDGSRRLALRSATSFTSSNEGKSHAQPEQVTVGYADVFPDGRFAPNPSLGMRISPASILPQLPADAAQLAKGWASASDALQPSTYTAQDFAAADDDANEFIFVSEQTGIMAKVYEMSNKSTNRFDRRKGVVTRITLEMSQGWGLKMKGSGETTLTSDETISPADAAALAADFDRLFEAQRQYTAAMQDVARDPDKADALLASAKEHLTAARDAAATDVARGELEAMLKKHEQYAKYTRDEAERFAKIVNKPSPEWMSTDIDGNRAMLADYRGKVVVLDFWYRGCGWCIYAMPQVIQLAEEYKDKPVAVLGMNTDQKESDARFVIDVLGLKYPTIKAEGIPLKYGIQGFPTLVIIDQAGIVRDIHVGYSPTLRENVTKKIDELLKESPKT